ncbi:winged helix DNA-binding domain-containing protein [Microbacterium sp. NPDC077663]|uniref:winged helix DNA-binding domain-containing protein n=1 Tax=Microbacterium sp. NPDC077663 TaxID=3364189 RepID=UPI0037CB558F
MSEPTEVATVRAHRLRSHLLASPAPDVGAVVRHLHAVQAQDFGAGRWALGIRTAGDLTVDDVDRAFDDGEIVRAWTQRGTLHAVAPSSVPGILAVTGERQLRALGADAGLVERAERVFRDAVATGGRATRAEFSSALEREGVTGSARQANGVLLALSFRGVLALGPVVPREDGVTREQYLVPLPGGGPVGEDPGVDLLLAYLRGHAPASSADFAWWAGIPAGAARAVVERAGDRVASVGDGLLVDREDAAEPDSSHAAGTLALPAFDEYTLAYADRSVALGAGDRVSVGPTANGMMRAVVLRGGVAVGTWRLSLAKGSTGEADALLFPGETNSGVDLALARVRRFFGFA